MHPVPSQSISDAPLPYRRRHPSVQRVVDTIAIFVGVAFALIGAACAIAAPFYLAHLFWIQFVGR
jgi:hypothetical protein